MAPLTPHFTRITLAGDELAHFGTRGLDQRIKLLMPLPGGRVTDFGLFDEPRPAMMEWYRRWRELADADRNALRTYTVRSVRPQAAEIDIDFVLHGSEGPASAWAIAAREGDPIVVIGPDQRAHSFGGGVEWNPGHATSVLLAGDETAAPAICAIVGSLDAEVTGLAVIEVPRESDALPVPTRSDVEVRWLARGDAPHGTLLAPAVREWGRSRATGRHPSLRDVSSEDILWEVPEAVPGGEYAWLAGEAGVITALRRHLVRDLGIDRRSVAFMGYWRRGRAEGA